MTETPTERLDPARELRKNVLVLLKRCHPDIVGSAPELAAGSETDVRNILSAIVDSRYSLEWPDDLKPGIKVAFFGLGPGGVVRNEPKPVPLPPEPAQFIAQLRTFLDTGVILTFIAESRKSDEDRYQEEFEHLLVQFRDSIPQTGSISQLHVKAEALSEIPVAYVNDLQLKKVIDNHASYLFSGRLSQPLTAKNVTQVRTQINEFPFSNQNLRVQLLKRIDERAEELFTRSLRSAKNQSNLDHLEDAVQRYYADRKEVDKERILSLVDRKGKAYAQKWTENEEVDE